MPKVVEVPSVGNVEFPDSMSDADISAAIRKTLSAQAPAAPAAAPERSFGDALLHAPGDLLQGLGSGVISTGLGAYNLARKLPVVGAALPEPSQTLQDAARPPAGYAGAIGHLAEQGAEFLLPVGAAADALKAAPLAARLAGESAAAALTTGVQTGGDEHAMGTSGLLAGALGSLGAGAAAGYRALLKGGSKEALTAGLLRASGEKEYAQFLNPTTRGNKIRTANIVPELIDRGVTAVTRGGFAQRAASELEAANQKLGQAWDALPPDAAIPLRPVQEAVLDAAHSELTAPAANGKPVPLSAEAAAGLKHAKGIAERLKQFASPNPETGELEIPATIARTVRQHYDKLSEQAGRFDGAAETIKSANNASAADAVRNGLAQAFPDIGAINKEVSLWADAKRVMDDTIMRKQGQARSLMSTIMRGAGTAGGFLLGGLHTAFLGRTAMGALEDAVQSPAWRTVGAVWKDRLADAIANYEKGPAQLAIGKLAGLVKNAEQRATLPTDAAALPAAEPAAAEAPAAGAAADPAAVTAGPVSLDPGTAGTRAPLPGAAAEAPGAAPAGQPADQTQILVPGDPTKYGATYQLRELADVQPSHNGLNFAPNPKYALKNDRDYSNPVNQGKILNGSGKQFDPRFHITDNPDSSNGPAIIDQAGNVVGGNGRSMMLQRVYGSSDPANALAYRALLAQKAAQFGIDPSAVGSMKQPVLTRVLDDSHIAPGEAANAVTDFNKTGTAALTPAERAIADSKRVSTGTLDHLGARLDTIGPDATIAQALEGTHGAELLDKLIGDGVVSPQERAALADKEGLTKAGKERIQGLVLGRFFRDPKQMDAMPDAIKNKVGAMAGPLAKVESSAEWSLTPQVKDALDLLGRVREAGGKSILDYVRQSGLFGKQEFPAPVVRMAQRLQSMTQNQLRAAVKKYAADASYAAQGPGLMGDAPTPAASFGEAFK